MTLGLTEYIAEGVLFEMAEKIYKVAICDDDPSDLAWMRRLLEENPDKLDKVQYYEYDSGEALMREAYKEHDLVILDVRMKGMDGNETAQKLRERNEKAVLVFFSGMCAPKPESVACQPFRYLLKDDGERKLAKEITAILGELRRKFQSTQLLVRWGKMLDRVQLSDILYIEKRRYGSTIHLCKGRGREECVLTTSERLDELYGRLVRLGFEYAHNSYIVNLMKVDRVKRSQIRLEGGVELSVSRPMSPHFIDSFLRFHGEGVELEEWP